MTPLRVGVVGLGIRGLWLARLAADSPATELVALADLNPDMRDVGRQCFPTVTIHQDGVALAGDPAVEAVLVGTGDRFHAQNAREALRAGKHVLVEKPLAQSFADLRELQRLEAASGCRLGTYLELRHSTLWRRAKAVLESGEVGQLYAATLLDHVGRDKAQFFGRRRARSRDQMVSLVLQKGVHCLDLLNWFLGSAPRRVAAVGKLAHFGGTAAADKRCCACDEAATCPHFHEHTYPLNPPGIVLDHGDDHCVWSSACDLEDISLLSIEYASGAVASYHEVHFAPYYSTHFTFYGSLAQLDVEANHDTNECWLQVTARHTQQQRRERPSRDTGHGGADPALLADFAAAVREGRPPLCDLRAGYESAQIGIATRLSLDSGQFVELPPFESP
ncbi:MAG: Gfo/Idh/MocA family oxidoreductase [Fimbriimonadaceae bacterium]|nr:Gfo/Idh/MocA family oxidoreductase [Fimbriimonadaceae bacterium]